MRDRVWKDGEAAALDRYTSLGFRLLARNWRCSLGELDLILERGALVVFCEVKARRGDMYGGPHEAVTPVKQRKLRRLAEAFLDQSPGLRGRPIRFDVASVSVRPRPSVHLYEDAF